MPTCFFLTLIPYLSSSMIWCCLIFCLLQLASIYQLIMFKKAWVLSFFAMPANSFTKQSMSRILVSKEIKMVKSKRTSMISRSKSEISSVSHSAEVLKPLPSLIVFDLDDCLWTPEMYTLPSKPSIPVRGDLGLGNGEQGVIGIKCSPSGPTVKLFDGARRALREIATNPHFKEVLLGVASSSEEPSFSQACLENIEILPGLTLRGMILYDQIGRTGKLSPRKTTHFRLIHQESNIPYEEMLFFDDCNWGDHVGDLAQTFGVVGQRTPNGMQFHEFEEGLRKYQKVAEERKVTG